MASNILPMNWPLSWRVMVLLNISFYNLMGNVFAAGLPPLFGSLVEDLGCTIAKASLLPGYALLALGLANIYALPLCAYIGKRYTILATMTVFLAVTVWSGEAKSYNSLVATRFVGGLAAGVIEAMGPLMVSETFPEHQLARAMVTYIGFLAGGSVLGPIFAGIIVTHLGTWRWFFRIMSICVGVNLICCIIILPETSFVGEWDLEDLDLVKSDKVAEKAEAAENIESNTPNPTETTAGSYAKFELWKERSFFLPWNMADITRPKDSRFGFISLILAPFPMMLLPAVFVSTIMYGLTIGCTVIYSILSADIFGPPPYLWSPEIIGLLPVSSLVGIVIGLPVGGIVADMLSRRQSTRANGHHNPRSRLPLVIAGFLISPSGLILSGYSLRPDHFTWVGFACGWAMLSFGLTASSNIVTTYCVDTFRDKAGHIGVLINVVKNCIGFGVSYSVVDWYAAQGPVHQFSTMAGLLWASYLLVIPVYFYHKRLTEFSNKIIRTVVV